MTGYVETAQPVGSSQVARDPVIEVSPATVRADMAALEREGYLTHPHTSAGRIPTDKGYRFFVDHLGNLQPLGRAEHEQVQVFFSKAHGELERVLQDTSRLLAKLTDCAAVVMSPAHETLVVRSALIRDSRRARPWRSRILERRRREAIDHASRGCRRRRPRFGEHPPATAPLGQPAQPCPS